MNFIRETRCWRSIATHVAALVAGIALATALTPRATQLIGSSSATAPPGAASEFDRALRAVMVQMNAAMCITPSVDADRDFARAMIPHHQGAVEMARLELLYGRDARLRRLAQGIVVEQSQEVALLRSILASSAPVLVTNLDP